MKFSIAIPAYNRKDYLAQAIASCLNQTVGDFEVIVSDDCSTDDLAAVVASAGSPKIRYSRSASRLGATANHQRAVSLGSGDYVVVLNSDDMLLPDCLEVAGRALDGCPNAAAVYFSTTYLAGAHVEGFHPIPRLSFANGEILAGCPWLEKFHGTTPSCCMFRRERFLQLGGYRPELQLAYDWDLYMRFLTVGGGVLFLPHVLGIYRKHVEQMVQTSSIDALKDMIVLWRDARYAHWPASDLAELCLPHLRAGVRDPRMAGALWRAVQGTGMKRRLAAGVVQVVARRILLRLGWRSRQEATADNYVVPENVDQAIRAAKAVVASMALRPAG